MNGAMNGATSGATGPDLPGIMGILNVTPDSFSDGGRHFSFARAVEAGVRMWEEGAQIVDVGGESTRPGAAPVPLDEELRRVVPVIRALSAAGVPTSIDTRHARVMEAALAAGATMVNDVSALTTDPDSLSVVAKAGVRVVLMHMRGTPETMQGLADYNDVVAEVRAGLAERVAACRAAGIPAARILVDPGIGFAKRKAHNLALLRSLESLKGLGGGVLLGASRKRFVADVAGPGDTRLGGSIAAALRGAEAGVDLLRVHDVAQTRQALLLWHAMRPTGRPGVSGTAGAQIAIAYDGREP